MRNYGKEATNVAQTTTYEAVVQKIVSDGRHEAYAVCIVEKPKKLSVTFSLRSRVWSEKRRPEPGEVVVLSHLTEKRAGWRANKARFKTVDD
jgi:hypothetical protein